MNTQPVFLTQDELAKTLKIRPGFVVALARDGRLPSIRIGAHTFRFDLDEVLQKLRGARLADDAHSNSEHVK